MEHPSYDTDNDVIGEAAVVEMDAVIDELYAVMRNDIPLEDKTQQALALGKQFLDVDNGHFTRIDTETDHWEALTSTDPPDGQFPPGLELDLNTTYCRRVFEEDSQIAVDDAPNQGWTEDIAYQTHGVRCYLGTPVLIDEELYGTVCFVNEHAREEPFSEIERLFSRFLTQLLERELENELHEERLTRQTNLSLVLNRVLRHNVRNNMAVIRGYTEMLSRNHENGEAAQEALEDIDDLLQLCEKARTLDRVVANDADHSSIELRSVVDTIADTVRANYPNATISVAGADAIVIDTLPSLKRALEELIENAAKHAGDAPTVEISVELVPNAVEIRVSDDGPGLNRQDAEVLQMGTETPLLHGSGLGLWLAQWIISSHNGTIETTDIADGNTIVITIPRKNDVENQTGLSELARARDKYEAAFEDANDGMVILDDQARILEANAAASEIYGMDEHDLLGQPIHQFLPPDFDFGTTWEQVKNGSLNRDTGIVIADGGIERAVEVSVEPDFIPDNHLVIARDISERERNE